MADKKLRILLVEDVLTDAELEVHELKRAGLRVAHRVVDTEDAFRAGLREFNPEIIISDFSMPHFDGMWALDLARELAPDVPFIFVSGTIGEEYAIRALRNGATDYVLKSNLVRLPAAVERALLENEERLARLRAEQALHESDARFRLLVENIRDYAIVALDLAGRVVSWNAGAERIQGYAADEIVGQHFSIFHPEANPPEHCDAILRAAASAGSHESEGWRLRKEGSRFWALVLITAIKGADGVLRGYSELTRDVTERREQEMKIARLTRIHQVLSGINSAIVRIRDRQKLFEEACRIAVEHGRFGIAWIGTLDPQTLEVTPVAHAGLQANESLANFRSSAGVDHPLGRGVVGRAIRERIPVFVDDLAKEPGAGEWRKEAMRRGYHSRIALPLVVDNAVVGVMVLFAAERNYFNEEELKLLTELAGDISFALEHIGKEEKLNYLAYYDALTGLPNRTLLEERLNRQLQAAREKGTKVAVLVGNVKRFRFINDSLGRHAGDALLRQLAARARRAWPEPDDVARLSADSFGGIVADLNDETAIAHLPGQLITEVLRQPFKIGDKDLSIAMAAGIAVFPADGSDADTLFRNAEAALKRAKLSGEHYLFYRPEMNARVAETLQLETKLRQALEREEFVLHYQPKVSLAKGTISGLEALIRWNDPESGLVPPVKFIPLLEETGMILETGRWAMRKAVADYQEWHRRGLQPPRIAVNVSPIQLRQKDFVEVVYDVIAKGGGSHGLDLEITESLIMEDIDGNIEKLRAVKNMGANIAIDDFGTGYSSLGYLAKLPVNALKIDRSFITTMTGSADSMTIVSTIISLAHALNLKVIAEGVDAEEQRNFLRLLKCDEMQGYLFSRPVPASEMEVLLAAGNGKPASTTP